jgi:NADPH:quinone reductase-like Zn-dependent oxidoreductase
MSDRMRAVVLRGSGGPDVLELREIPRPEPGRGEVRVRVASSGLNRADLLQRMGRYPAPPGSPPDILGLELAGTVDAV